MNATVKTSSRTNITKKFTALSDNNKYDINKLKVQ